jgi:hypothetical protein
MSKPVSIRIFALKYNLDRLVEAYAHSRKDSLLEVGLNYEKTYDDNEEFQRLDKAYQDLVIYKENVLFTCVLNFSQSYYTIKEFIKNTYPHKTKVVEEFFSTPTKNNISRKKISNDLKHNPENDIKYDFKEVKRETKYSYRKVNHIIYMKQSWFYGEFESVEYCQQLYKELIGFLKAEFN